MDAGRLLDALEDTMGIDTFYGVPDSLLRAFCDEVVERRGYGNHHVVAANEGGACALAAGHYLATGTPACVYLQNSGIGNAVNPICSLLNDQVYGLPALFVVGWRGEPGVADEPQHVFQGACSQELLECVGLSVDIIDDTTTDEELMGMLAAVSRRLAQGRQAALLVRKGALSRSQKASYGPGVGSLLREQALAYILGVLPDDAVVVSTTGKLSRELFELREKRGEGHERDFLTVGSMGHVSMIGLAVALDHPHRPVVVLDGDGAALMHAGALAIVGNQAPENFVHVLVDNNAHESVGGMPTVSSTVDWCTATRAFGYASAQMCEDGPAIEGALRAVFAKQVGRPAFIEIPVLTGARDNLGRPTIPAIENGRNFKQHLDS